MSITVYSDSFDSLYKSPDMGLHEVQHFKIQKLCCQKGKALNTCPFALKSDSESAIISDKDQISSIHSKAIQWLGRIINDFLSDRRATDELRQNFLDGLFLIDKSFFKRGRKLWINQILFMPCIR